MPEPSPDAIKARKSRAAESILANESLTADLDDSTAQVLLEWGIALAESAAQRTSGMQEAEAGEMMSSRLRATRQLMRSVNNWIARRCAMSPDQARASLDEIITHANAAYGPTYALPSEEERLAFLDRYLNLLDTPPQIVQRLRALVGNAPGPSISSPCTPSAHIGADDE